MTFIMCLYGIPIIPELTFSRISLFCPPVKVLGGHDKQCLFVTSTKRLDVVYFPTRQTKIWYERCVVFSWRYSGNRLTSLRAVYLNSKQTPKRWRKPENPWHCSNLFALSFRLSYHWGRKYGPILRFPRWTILGQIQSKLRKHRLQ